MRHDKRENDQIRPVTIENNFIESADGSVLITVGNTKVIVTAIIEDKVPPFLRGENKGWITAEYSMLPGSTQTRKARDRKNGADGRSIEIQRLIGRALRSVLNLDKLGERTVWIDCDVIQADGGTRTASITGAYVALRDAINKLIESGELKENPIEKQVAAISVGIPAEIGEPVLDLDYTEDKGAMVDMNMVMTDTGEIIEVQGTGEERPFSFEELNSLMSLAKKGIDELIEIQNESKPAEKKTKVILATHNQHKVAEVADILGDDFKVLSASDVGITEEPVEDGKTIEDNAKIKVDFLKEKLGDTDAILLADDTGLFVDSLNGQPGVYSARYSGDNATYESNNKKLLKELEGVDNRDAEFKTSVAIAFPDGTEETVTGMVDGTIGQALDGSEGFGYDPLFIENTTGKTYANMSLEEKNQVSHRAKAINKAVEEIGKWTEKND